MTTMLRVGVIGFGYWGPNVARNLTLLPDTEIALVCDVDPERLAVASRHFPAACCVSADEQVFRDDGLDAVVIATPATTHYGLAKRALASRKHVLVEKPLAMTARECEELGDLATEAGLTLMVGHTFLYNSAVRWLRQHVQRGDLGRVLYIYSQRLNLGRIRLDVNVLWNLAPHDVSILLYLLDALPLSVSAHGRGFLREDVEDVVFLTLELPGGCLGHLHVSWLDPRKVRRVTVVGTKKMVIYDDVNVEARLQVYDKGIDVVSSPESAGERRHENLGEFQTLVRSGDLLIPRIEFIEPLRVQCQEFVDAIREARVPLTDARHAAGVVRVLEAATESLRSGGERVPIKPEP